MLIVAPFTAAHLTPELAMLDFVNGLSGALALGMCFMIAAKRSYPYAFVATALLHFLHNAFAFVLDFFHN